MLYKNKTKNASLKSGYRGLLALLMVVGMVSLLLTGCVKSEAGISLEGPKGAECASTDPLQFGKVEKESFISTIEINLADYKNFGALYGFNPSSAGCSATPPEPKYLTTSAGPILINLAGKNDLTSTLTNASIGAGPELRIDQNGFTPSKVVYTITDDKKLGLKITPKPLSGTYIGTGTEFSITGVDFINATEAEDWLNALTNASLTDVYIQLSAQLEGALGGGKKATSTAINFAVHLTTTPALKGNSAIPTCPELDDTSTAPISTPTCSKK